jgi:hypothetical protein
LHARQQTLAMLDTTTGEVVEVTLQHEGDNVREFCRRGQKQQKSSDACAGMPETRNGAKSHRPVD